MKIIKSILPLMLVMLIGACVEKMQLPDSLNSDSEFLAGDTTYILIQPIWDDEMGLVNPIEISIAQDGHVFVADTGTASILVFGQDGEALDGFEALKLLSSNPVDVDVDQKMNVYFIDGSQKIYIWDQYINDVGVDSMLVTGYFYNENAGYVEVDVFTDDWHTYLNDEDWQLAWGEWGKPEATIDSILDPHIFYDGSDEVHTFKDIYYESENSTFSGISATRDDDNYIYTLDYEHNRIIRVDLERTYFLKLSNGETIWTHRGVFHSSVSESGTGAGTVNQPLGIDVDYNGNIYYAQTGDFFSIHKIRPSTSGTYTTYPSVFQAETNDIMDLFRFSKPSDVAVDENQFVYVANSQAQEIQVFDSDGQFFRKAGIEMFTIDTVMQVIQGTDTVSVDTFITVEEKGFIVEPQSVTVDNRGIIYICDTETGRILRYRLSNLLDEDLVPIP